MRKMASLLLLAFFGFCRIANGAEIRLEPTVLENGGLARLRFNGEKPASAEARFNGKSFDLIVDAQGAWSLIGVDLETPTGHYPLLVRVTDSRGTVSSEVLEVEVKGKDRGQEHLQLPEPMVSPRDPAILERISREKKMTDRIFAKTSPRIPELPFGRPTEGPPSTPFGRHRILNGIPKSPHAGIDFSGSDGAPVVAAGVGEVVFSGDLYYTGKTVILDHGQGLYTVYAHMRKILCSKNRILRRGSPVGEVGSTGRSTGPHLHWGVKLRGDRVDPAALLEGFSGEKP